MGEETPKYASGSDVENKFSLNRPGKEPEKNYHIGESDIMVLNNPTIKIPKEVLDSLDKKFVGLRTKVIDLTQNDLVILKSIIDEADKTKDYSKLEEKLRSELIEEDVENGTVTLDTLTTGVKEGGIDKVKSYMGDMILKKLGESIEKYSLDSQQKENLKIGIVSKIIKSGFFDKNLSNIKSILDKPDINKLKDFNPNFDKEVDDIININTTDLTSLFNTKETTKESLKVLLSNLKNIEDYKVGTDITSLTEMKPEELKKYLLGINNKIKGIEGDIKMIKEQVKTMFNSNKFGDLLKDGMMGFLMTILTSIGKFLGLDQDQIDSMFPGFSKKDKENKKSVDTLKTFGKKIEGQNTIDRSGEIDVINDVDLSKLDANKIKPFLDNCRQKGIDITKDDFWVNVLKVNTIKIPEITDASLKITKPGSTIKFSTIKPINGDDFYDFYKTLNSTGFITVISPEVVAADSKDAKKDNETKMQEEKKIKIDQLKTENSDIISVFSFIDSDKNIKIKDIIKNTKGSEINLPLDSLYMNSGLTENNKKELKIFFDYIKKFNGEKKEYENKQISDFLVKNDKIGTFKIWLNERLKSNNTDLGKLGESIVPLPLQSTDKSFKDATSNEDISSLKLMSSHKSTLK